VSSKSSTKIKSGEGTSNLTRKNREIRAHAVIGGGTNSPIHVGVNGKEQKISKAPRMETKEKNN